MNLCSIGLHQWWPTHLLRNGVLYECVRCWKMKVGRK